MSTTNHIIVPIDFSEQSTIALNQSYNLARLTGADITLIHVVDEDMFSSMLNLFADKDKQIELLMTGVKFKMNEVAEEVRQKSGLNVQIRIEHGKIYEQVVKVAEELNAAFIIMGTNGPTTLRKKFIGSNAIRVINEAHCPVITIKGKEHRSGCNTIVLPLDLTKETKEKVGKCIEIARYFNSEVKVVSVIETEDEFLVNKLTRQMEQVVDFIKNDNIKCAGELIHHKNISETVIEYCNKVKADLLIIMTQQEMEWNDFFIGTKSQYVINHCDIPVCSIRPKERKDMTEFVIS
jgi:nucleotide-binding universal stress UspA family protein